MASFAIIAEGRTDQWVIENILYGQQATGDSKPVVNPVQPPLEPPLAPGGWTLVFKALRDGEIGKALTFNDYVIVHIDTDVCEDPGFDVPRRIGSRLRTVDELIDAVAQRLDQEIGALISTHRDRILYAIAVDSIECWLLPLLFESQSNKAGKTTGCLDAANDALRAADRRLLKRGEGKDLEAYRSASDDYSKRRVLIRHQKRNPSLGRFVARLPPA